MAPSLRGGRRRKTSTCCKPNCHGILLKKKPNVAIDGCCSSKPSSSDQLMEEEEEEEKKNYNAINLLDGAPTDSGFSTPKAKRSRISDALSCPPAPKKRRLAAPRRPENTPLVSFFTSPDLDLFFLVSRARRPALACWSALI